MESDVCTLLLRRRAASAEGGACASCWPPALPRATAEQAFENITQIGLAAAKVLKIFRAKAALLAPSATPHASAVTSTTHSAERIGRVAVAIDFATVELGAFVLVRQQVIGLRHFAEPVGSSGIVPVGVGMQLFGELAISALDVLFGRGSGNAQRSVRISHA